MSTLDRLYASDPGLRRLLAASRATLAFAIAVVTLVVLALVLGVSPALVIPGMVIASVAASAQGADLTPRQRFQTLLMMAVSGTAGLILGALSTGNPLLLGALFLGLILAVLASTPLGIGGTLVALAALASFYGATMLSPAPEQLPWAIGSAALGALIAAVLLGVVFRDSDVADAGRMLRSLRARASRVIEAVPQGASRTRLDQFAALVASVRGQLAKNPSGWPVELRDADGAALAGLVERLEIAVASGDAAGVRALASDPLLSLAPVAGSDAAPASAARAPINWALTAKALRAPAVQLLVATASAMVVARLIDPAHWFWCVVAALIMLFGTGSASAALDKGVRRIIGTAVGLPVGLALGTLVQGNQIAIGLLVLAGLFGQQYFANFAYEWSIFSLSLMFGVLFGQAGATGTETLVLRLVLTVVGVVIGGVVALTVMPAKTGPLLAKHADGVLGAVAAAVAAVASGGSTAEVDAAARKAGEGYRALAAEVEASRRIMPLSAKYGSLSSQVAAGSVVVRELRRLAYDYAPGADPAVAALAAAVGEHVEALRAGASGGGVLQGVARPEVSAAAGRDPQGVEKDAACADTLLRLDLALAGLQDARRG